MLQLKLNIITSLYIHKLFLTCQVKTILVMHLAAESVSFTLK